MNLSDFGKRYQGYSGITHLMDDLSEGLAQPGVVMLGGGNPAAIPEVKAFFSKPSPCFSGNSLAGISVSEILP
jgi:valine--pyruvate aminotransferase